MQEWKGFLPANAIVMARSGVKPGQKPRAKNSSTTNAAPMTPSATQTSSTTQSSPARMNPAPTAQPISTASKLIFVGDAIQGQASQLLDRMIEAMGVPRANVSIVAPEAATSLELNEPSIIVALGEKALRALLQAESSAASLLNEPFDGLRSRFHAYRGSQLISVFHPSELIKSPLLKKDVWTDLQKVVKEMGIAIPKRN
jgi:DNA polymerase III psi subunit